MDKRTPDHVKFVTQKFFDDPDLGPAVSDYFRNASVQEKLAEGYLEYQNAIEEAKKDAPEGATFLAEVDRKYARTKPTYEQEIFEAFKEMLAEIMSPAAVFISVKEPLKAVLRNESDENLKMLLLSTIEEVYGYMLPRVMNFVTLLSDGVPVPMAEKIVNTFGEAEIVPVEIEIRRAVDEENDDDNDYSEDEKYECCGECGGRCDCEEKEKCKETGHCQHEDTCNCSNHTDK